ncbi:hypothetical protein KXW38_001980, partial [Aspergillus fumigatus]
ARHPQLAEGPQRGAGDPARRARRHAGPGPAGGSPRAARSRALSRALAAAGGRAARLDAAGAGQCGLHQRTVEPTTQRADRRCRRGTGAGRQLGARHRRHLCRLRQPQGPADGERRRADPAVSADAADPDRADRAAGEDPRPDLGPADAIRPRRSQRRRPGDGEGG